MIINILSDAVCWLDEYFAGNVPSFTPKLKLQGSEFRKTVSEIMLKIPYGELSTYGEIANEVAMRIGKDRMSAQAVGGSVGSNEFSIIVPCHRVVGKNGNSRATQEAWIRRFICFTMRVLISRSTISGENTRRYN